MPKHPDRFPDLDLEGAGIELPEGVEPEFLAGGFNSSAWIAEDRILKVTSRPRAERKAGNLLDAMQSEHDMMVPYIGQNMVRTELSLVEDRDGSGFRVVTAQPFMEGPTPPEFFSRPNANAEPFISFLERSREAFRQTGLMPDIGCIERDFFWPLSDRNVVILEDRDDHPMLVDVNSGKTQRSAMLGPIWNRLIYMRAGHAINHLSWRLHEAEANAQDTELPVQTEDF